MNRKNLIASIREILNTEIPLDAIANSVERLMNTEIPGTPSLTGRAGGARVMYVAIPGKGRNRAALSDRAAQVLAFLDKNRKASSGALQVALGVNRNVIAGAVHELKQAGVVTTQAFGGGGSQTSAAGFEPRLRATSRARGQQNPPRIGRKRARGRRD